MDDTLSNIKKYATLLFTVPNIAFKCNVEESVLRTQIRTKKGEMYEAYMEGKLNTMEKIHTQAIEMAAAGSPQAESLVLEYLDNQKRNE